MYPSLNMLERCYFAIFKIATISPFVSGWKNPTCPFLPKTHFSAISSNWASVGWMPSSVRVIGMPMEWHQVSQAVMESLSPKTFSPNCANLPGFVLYTYFAQLPHIAASPAPCATSNIPPSSCSILCVPKSEIRPAPVSPLWERLPAHIRVARAS